MISLDFARKAIEAYYEGTADVTEEKLVKDPKTGISKPEQVDTLKGEPCRLSYITSYTSGTNPLPEAQQLVKLFIAPEIEIGAGSRISIEQHGHRVTYRYSSHCARYCTHQEIWLKRLEDEKL